MGYYIRSWSEQLSTNTFVTSDDFTNLLKTVVAFIQIPPHSVAANSGRLARDLCSSASSHLSVNIALIKYQNYSILNRKAREARKTDDVLQSAGYNSQ